MQNVLQYAAKRVYCVEGARSPLERTTSKGALKSELSMIGVSVFGLTHQTSTITPSTPALLRAIRLARRARGLLTVFNIVIESKGSMIYTGTGPCKFNNRGVSSLWELRSRQRVCLF